MLQVSSRVVLSHGHYIPFVLTITPNGFPKSRPDGDIWNVYQELLNFHTF